MARTLVAFEYLWYQAWVQSIEQAKAGLQVRVVVGLRRDGSKRRERESAMQVPAMPKRPSYYAHEYIAIYLSFILLCND